MQTEQIPSTWRIDRRKDGIAVFDETGQARCGAKKTTDGGACHKFPMEGHYRCRKHRGPGLTGENHPNFKNAGKSRYVLPPRLQTRYQELLESPNLGDLSENVALLDIRLQELLKRMDVGDFGASYNTLRNLHNRANREMDTAFHGTDPDERKKALASFISLFNDMGDLITVGQKDYQTWAQILDVTAERRQVTKTMADIEHKGENAVPVSEVWALLMQWKDLFERVNRLQTEEERKREMGLGLSKLVNFKAG